jgi:hypothetical protein
VFYNAAVDRISERWAAPPPGTAPTRADILLNMPTMSKHTTESGTGQSPVKVDKHRFAVTVTLNGGVAGANTQAATEQVLCKSIVMATGLTKPNVPASVIGIEHAIGYEDLPETGRCGALT